MMNEYRRLERAAREARKEYDKLEAEAENHAPTLFIRTELDNAWSRVKETEAELVDHEERYGGDGRNYLAISAK